MSALRTIYLHGSAQRRFGGPFRFEVASPIEAVRALCCQLKGFDAFMRASDWKIIRGRGPAGRRIDENELGLQFGSIDELHLVPIAAGRARGKGAGKIVLGAAIMAAAVALSAPSGGGSIFAGLTAEGGGLSFAGSVALSGASIVLGGVSQLLAKAPTVKSYNSREPAGVNRPSYLFNGPVNVVAEGAAIPVICGRRIRVGSVVISAGIFTERFKPS
jgi:predicted phage tail protein